MKAERRHRYCYLALLVAACALGLAVAADNAAEATETGDAHSDSDPTSATADEAAHADDEHEDGSHGGHEVYAVLMPWFVQALGIVVFFILTRHVHGLPCECYLLSCKRFL